MTGEQAREIREDVERSNAWKDKRSSPKRMNPQVMLAAVFLTFYFLVKK